MSAGNLNPEWHDPDDAPEITAEDLKRGVWAIDGKIVSENEGRAAFTRKLQEHRRGTKSKKPLLIRA
ncbi:hypothetical protein [Polynucleobacter sp.]|uniref:hypothetical protein n=1 Tax=Polynucleobacter sp. TaxID=2029855 RepID=UPI00334297C4